MGKVIEAAARATCRPSVRLFAAAGRSPTPRPRPPHCTHPAPVCPLDGNPHTVHHAKVRDIEYATMPGQTFDIHRCPSCDVLFIHPMPVDRLGEIYPKTYYSFVGKQKNLVTYIKEWLDSLYFRRIMAAMPGDKLSAIDVGGGDGWLLDVLKNAIPASPTPSSSTSMRAPVPLPRRPATGSSRAASRSCPPTANMMSC